MQGKTRVFLQQILFKIGGAGARAAARPKAMRGSPQLPGTVNEFFRTMSPKKNPDFAKPSAGVSQTINARLRRGYVGQLSLPYYISSSR